MSTNGRNQLTDDENYPLFVGYLTKNPRIVDEFDVFHYLWVDNFSFSFIIKSEKERRLI